MALFLSPQEVASRWNCSARHVTRLCAGGELPAMRLGPGMSPWRISVSAVEAYEAAQQTGSHVCSNATPKQEPSRRGAVAQAFVPGDFDLPDGYVPRFPELWRNR